MTSQRLIFKEIPMENIVISELNVRKNLEAGSEDTNLEDLARSINEKGLLNPITVFTRQENYELIAGQRRFLACQLLGWKTIPSLIRSDVDDLDARIISLVENVHRADLHPLDKGRAYDQLYDNFGTYDRVSKETGVSYATIRKYMNLLKLSPSIQKLLTTSDGPAGSSALSMLAVTFPNFDDQERALRLIKGLKQQVQLEILKLCEGSIDKIIELVGLALEGYFTPYVCTGLGSCPYIPESCKDEVLKLVMTHSEINVAARGLDPKERKTHLE